MPFSNGMMQQLMAQRQPQASSYQPAFGPYGPPPQMSQPYTAPRMDQPQPAFGPGMPPNMWQGLLQGRGAGGMQTGVAPSYQQFMNQHSPTPGTFDMTRGLAAPWQSPGPNPMGGGTPRRPPMGGGTPGRSPYGGIVGGAMKEFIQQRGSPGSQPGPGKTQRPGTTTGRRFAGNVGGTRGRRRRVKGGLIGSAGPTKMAQRGAFEGVMR